MKLEYAPLVSVLTPVYNGERYLRAMMDSIIAQTFTDFEWVIINDGSTDNTEQIIKSYTDNRIRYFTNDGNKGIAKTYNRAIGLAKGKYLAIAEADDVNHPKRLAVSVNYLEQHPDIGMMSGQLLRFEKSTPHSESVKITDKIDCNPMQLKCAAIYSGGGGISHAAQMIRASVLAEHGIKYDERYKISCDYALVMDMVRDIKMVCLHPILVFHRWHGGNTSDSREAQTEANEIVNRFLNKHFGLALDIDRSLCWDVVSLESFTTATRKCGIVLEAVSSDKGYDYALLRRCVVNFIDRVYHRMYVSGVDWQTIFETYKKTPLMRFVGRKQLFRIYVLHLAYKLRLIKYLKHFAHKLHSISAILLVK